MIKKSGMSFFVLCLATSALSFLGVNDGFAQFSRNSSGYGNNMGYGGYNSGGYGGYNSGGYGGYNSGYGGSMGGSMGGGMMGRGSSRSSMMGGMRSSSRSSRGGSNSGYGSGYNQGGYGSQGGYNSYGSRSSRGRSSRNSRNSNYNQSGYLPQSAPGTTNAPGQTSPQGTSTARNRSLSGKTSTGAAPSQGGEASQGGVRILGKPQFGKTGGAPGKRVPGAAARQSKESKVTPKPTANFFLNSRTSIGVIDIPITVDLVLANSGKIGFNQMDITLKYDPQVLQPITGEKDANGDFIPATSLITSGSAENADVPVVGGEDSPLHTFLMGKGSFKILKNEVKDDEGRIVFAARVDNETATDSGLIGQIQFLPLKETRSTSIRFDFNNTGEQESDAIAATDLLLSGKDQLGSTFDPHDGVVNIDFEITSSLEKAKERPVVQTENERFTEESTGSLGTILSLIPRQDELDVGDTVDIDVYLQNPNREAIDAVSLLIAYNPRVFEPVDMDDYAAGINLEDKEYFDNFPFDFPLVNMIDESRGLIDYRKRVNRSPVRGEGVLATICLRAIRPTTKTTLRIFLNESGDEPTTGIFYRNMDRLGDPSDRFDGVKSTSLSVRPTTAYLRRNQILNEKG